MIVARYNILDSTPNVLEVHTAGLYVSVHKKLKTSHIRA